MTGIHYKSPFSRYLWHLCQGGQANHLAVIREILVTLDAAEAESSVRNRHLAKGEWDLQSQVTLLEHSVRVATLCRQLARGSFIEGLTVIAGLAHDIGKLPELHPGEYAQIMHAYWGGEFVRRIVVGRLIPVQAEAVVHAIRYHHIGGDGQIIAVLREADQIARGKELMAVVDEVQGGPR